MIGDSKGGQFDVATRGARQPGSAYKPFTYAAALENGIHPSTTYDSKSPYSFEFNDGADRFDAAAFERPAANPHNLPTGSGHDNNSAVRHDHHGDHDHDHLDHNPPGQYHDHHDDEATQLLGPSGSEELLR